jgi:PRTRC genetic system protein E
MFIELMPLIEKRAITITVAALKDGHVRVNVVPAALSEDSKVNEKIGYPNKDKITKIPESAIRALTTPLSLTGAPDEIDAQLAEQLKAFVDSHLALQQSVDRARVMRDSSCSRGIAAVFQQHLEFSMASGQAGLSGK